ncbi:MAG: dCMP deaminase [Magnetococcales bacterium]|nr:dCMP deaminase [Magnetococcales bacterium]
MNKHVHIVIDAIRHPLEVIYFRGKYPSFFLVAVSTTDKERKDRLIKQNYLMSDIESIDNKEYSKTHNPDEPSFYSTQDIQGCLQRADIYIRNPNEETSTKKYKELTKQIIRYVTLIMRPGIVTPSHIERCMQIAYSAKYNSGCISRQVGAVITDKNYSIRSIGWNDVPFGHVPCNLRSRDDLVNDEDGDAYSCFEKEDERYKKAFTDLYNKNKSKYEEINKQGRNNAFCFKEAYNEYIGQKNQVHTRSLHAEENAFLQIAKYGVSSIEGGILFTTASPCELCSKKAYQLGISKIYYIDPYPGISIDHILKGGKYNPKLILFSGAVGRAFHELYSPVVPYKDELKALLY